MKKLLLLFLCSFSFAGEDPGPDWEYSRKGYSVNQPADDPTRATLVGPEFPYGIHLEVSPLDAPGFQEDLILLVNRLARVKAAK